jgi:protein TonB
METGQDTSKRLSFLMLLRSKENPELFMEEKVEGSGELSADEMVYTVVEEMPEYPGGEAALRKFISEKILYPVIAQENGIQGKVYVTFVVSADGSVKNAKIARGVDPVLDKEALRVVSTMPRWTPGKQRGKAVNVFYTIPISFILQ